MCAYLALWCQTYQERDKRNIRGTRDFLTGVLKNKNKKPFIYFCLCRGAYYGPRVEVRGQLAGISSFLTPCGSQDLNSGGQ